MMKINLKKQVKYLIGILLFCIGSNLYAYSCDQDVALMVADIKKYGSITPGNMPKFYYNALLGVEPGRPVTESEDGRTCYARFINGYQNGCNIKWIKGDWSNSLSTIICR